MEKILEDYLWNEIDNKSGRFAKDVIDDMVRFGMIQNPKQAFRTLEKWTDKKKWEYGTWIATGWKRL